MIAEELQEYLATHIAEQRITDVRFGSRYTAVMLEDGNVGVAYTYREQPITGSVPGADKLSAVGRTTTEILPYLESSDGLERTVGLAAINALVNRRGSGQHEADILHALAVGFLDRVGMVGHFEPLVASLERRARELVIFDRHPSDPERVLPAEKALEQLPHCDVAIITATTLVFDEAEAVLEAASKCREVALVGPSTPLVPEVFGLHGVTMLSGMTVNDGAGLLKVVSNGSGTRAFGECIRRVNVRPAIA